MPQNLEPIFPWITEALERRISSIGCSVVQLSTRHSFSLIERLEIQDLVWFRILPLLFEKQQERFASALLVDSGLLSDEIPWAAHLVFRLNSVWLIFVAAFALLTALSSLAAPIWLEDHGPVYEQQRSG